MSLLGSAKPQESIVSQCSFDYFTITTPGNKAPPTICGTNSGYHSKIIARASCEAPGENTIVHIVSQVVSTALDYLTISSVGNKAPPKICETNSGYSSKIIARASFEAPSENTIVHVVSQVVHCFLVVRVSSTFKKRSAI